MASKEGTMKISEPHDKLRGSARKLEADSVLDFWRWAYAILANDPTKGEFAEWMVGKLLGLKLPPGGRIEGADWDLLYGDVKIEVKAAAYWQAWKLRDRQTGAWLTPSAKQLAQLTPIKFVGMYRQPTIGSASAAAFKAQLYVFCLQHEQDPSKWDAFDLSQWSFFMLQRDHLCLLKEARDSACKNGKIPKSFILPLTLLERETPRMTANEFQSAAPKVIESIARELRSEARQ